MQKMDDLSALLDDLINGPLNGAACDGGGACGQGDDPANDSLSAPMVAVGDPHWPGDKLRRRVEAEAKRRRCLVAWVQEETRANGEVIETRRYWKFERLPTPRKKQRPACNAVCRDGHNCRARVVVRKDGTLANRCRLHGGLSTGPRTEEGRAAIIESNRRRAKR
jgi:hypothetical protein